jgi:DNA-binding LacI/PurR family transcriptional regulator
VSPDIRENSRLHSQLTELKVPFVFCHRNAEGIDAPVVAFNIFYAGYIATKHLLEKGYRHIAYISRYKNATCLDRCHGYITALLESGVKVNPKIIVLEDRNHMQFFGYETMKKVLASGQLVDAVICFNDQAIRGVYQAIGEAGLVVSDDIGVIGSDNDDVCEKVTPAVTSLAYKNLEMGTKAAEMLYKQINKEDLLDYQFYLFQPEIVERSSCLGLKKA